MNRRDEPSRAVDTPEPGFFRMKLVRGGPYVGARIIRGDDGWSAEIDGNLAGPPNADPAHAMGVFAVWHSGERIAETEHAYLLAVSRWARANDPRHPAADPWRPVDLTQQKSLF